LLDRTAPFDDEVLSVVARPTLRPSGLFPADAGSELVERDERDAKGAGFSSEVVIRRHGELPLPTELRVRFADGEERRERVPADGRVWHRFTYERPHPVVAAEVDPDGRRAIDASRLDDGRRAEPEAAPRRALMHRLALLLQTLLSGLE
jgi:hypothetical protein